MTERESYWNKLVEVVVQLFVLIVAGFVFQLLAWTFGLWLY